MAHSLINLKDVKTAIENMKIDNDINDVLNWIEKATADHNKNEFMRLHFSYLIDSLLNCLGKNNDREILSRILIILLRLFHYNISHPSPQRQLTLQQISDLIDILELEKCYGDLNIENLTLKCIKYAIKIAVINSKPNDERMLITLLRKLMANVRVLHNKFNRLTDAELFVWNYVILNSLRCINSILSNFKISIDNSLCGEILGILKVHSFHGIPSYDISKISLSSIYPSPFAHHSSIDDPNLNRTKRSVKKNKRKNKASRKPLNDDDDEEIDNHFEMVNSHSNSGSGTSESEVSSSDYENNSIDHIRAVKNFQTKIRETSYDGLLSVAKLSERRVLFGFWSSFIPDSSCPIGNHFNVLTSVLKDPSPKIRLSALCFIHELLKSGEQFVMALADEKNTVKQLSFMPISLTLASMIGEIHRGFCLVLFAETHAHVLLQTFKCINVLVNESPYNKLNTGLLINLMHKLSFLLNHKDIQIQNGCLVLYDAIFSLEPLPNELREWMVKDDGINCCKKLTDFCVNHILNLNSVILCGESLKLLSTILKPNVVSSSIKFIDMIQILEIGERCALNDIALKNNVIQNLVCKFLFAIGMALKSQSEQTMETQIIIKWWRCILQSQLIINGLIPQPNDLVLCASQCIIIDFISTIGSNVFEELKSSERFHLITVLFNFAKNDEPTKDGINVRSSAIHCVGLIQEFPSLAHDLSFITDVSHISMDALNDFSSIDSKDIHILAYQTSWALANSTDVLKKYYCDNTDVSVAFLVNILRSVIREFDVNIREIQSDNIKTNFTRAIGNTIYLLLLRESDINAYPDICNATGKLILCLKKSKSNKLQWNICYAFTYLLMNERFMEICRMNSSLKSHSGFVCETLADEIIMSLKDLMNFTRNHKVQSYCVDALCSIKKSEHYGAQDLCELWCQIGQFMIINFSSVPSEMKQNWIDKFCNGLIHLLSICKCKDNINMKVNVKEFLHEIQTDFITQSVKDNQKYCITVSYGIYTKAIQL